MRYCARACSTLAAATRRSRLFSSPNAIVLRSRSSVKNVCQPILLTSGASVAAAGYTPPCGRAAGTAPSGRTYFGSLRTGRIALAVRVIAVMLPVLDGPLAVMAVPEQTQHHDEEHRHEEDREQRRRQHAADHRTTDRILPARTCAGLGADAVSPPPPPRRTAACLR
ncbi:hypothetical protein WR25_18163 [Diploscapter pachys]|uniref:Uncharacterized protein n=1 Tax=Diploscapter pachys TaxID=2018661 RepID=A0A2A2KCE9_9BILA|nr:hypothetical protein WR25_18163 [Diploscapter pachys]